MQRNAPRTLRGLALGLVAAAVLAACDPQSPEQNEPLPEDRNPEPQAARADLEPVAEGTANGVVEFMTDAAGTMTIHARFMGLTPGTHGLHIHEIGDCSAPDGSSAGEHLAPEGDSHGAPAAAHEEHHAGDLGNITAAASGAAEKTMQDDELALDGRFGVVGRAIVVHANQDDLKTQPSGDSGDPVACGIIETAEHREPVG